MDKILLASHGTSGARAAEAAALDMARREGARVVHLYVVPDFWRGMRGDDWLNNASTRDTFGNYVEGELAREAREQVERLAGAAREMGVKLVSQAMFGKPADCLLRAAAEEQPDMVMMGAPRPRGEKGYSSRMKLEALARGLKAPLMIVPLTARPGGVA